MVAVLCTLGCCMLLFIGTCRTFHVEDSMAEAWGMSLFSEDLAETCMTRMSQVLVEFDQECLLFWGQL